MSSIINPLKLINCFFNIECLDVEGASELESETFLFLIDSSPKMAIDFLNCWLMLRNIGPLDDSVLSDREFFDIINSRPRKKKKKGKKKKK